jgi:hypothetical protein
MLVRNRGREIVERGVATMGAVSALDEVETPPCAPRPGFEASAVEQLTFKRGEETLTHGIVETIAD